MNYTIAEIGNCFAVIRFLPMERQWDFDNPIALYLTREEALNMIEDLSNGEN